MLCVAAINASCYSNAIINVKLSELYNRTDSNEALKKRMFRSLLRLDFHSTVSLLSGHAFALRISRSFNSSLDLIKRLGTGSRPPVSFLNCLGVARSPCCRRVHAMYSVLMLFI